MKVVDMAKTRKSLAAQVDIRVDELKACLKDYNTVHEFKPGDIVQIKSICGAPMRMPEPGEPVIVMATNVKVAPGEVEPMTAGQNELGIDRSMRIGMVTEGLFTTYLVDPNRFEPFTE